MTRDEMIDFLENLGIKTKLIGDNLYYKREIEFHVYGIRYVIEHYPNVSTLKIGDGYRRACIPFKYMYFDETYPLIGKNKSVGFSYQKNDNPGIYERMYPYEVLRIPLELDVKEVA